MTSVKEMGKSCTALSG